MSTQLNRIVRLTDLPQFCGLKRTQIDALVAAGQFPRPVKLSARRKGWLFNVFRHPQLGYRELERVSNQVVGYLAIVVRLPRPKIFTFCSSDELWAYPKRYPLW